MSESIAAQKAYALAVRVVKLCRVLRKRVVEYELLNQLLRSGTSVAANLAESVYACSSSDYQFKQRIALKECSETHMWLRLLHATGGLTEPEFASIGADCEEILKMLTATLRTFQKTQIDATQGG